MKESHTDVRPAPHGERLARLGRLVAARRRHPLVRRVAGLCRRYLAWYENHSYDLLTNGESFVLRMLADFRPRVIFDVGANVGQWCAEARACCPDAEVHAFEISPPTFELLEGNMRREPGLYCRNFGLSDAPGRVSLRHYFELPELTTSSAYPHPFDFTELTGEVMRGDDYASGAGVEHIDLLKIDVEGMEERVLRGFERMLKRGAIDLVQFEYGRVNILNRFLLADFHSFFRERGYLVGKVFPNYVEFRDYELDDENFLGPNYLACREEKAEYLRAFSANDYGRRL